VYVTVTANPSVDRTIEVLGLVRGGLHRATGVHVQPGGKGINVARALVCNGIKARAVVPAGGAEGEQLISLLSDYSIEVVRVPALGPVRMNVSVIEPDATVTKLNEPGARLTATETRALADAVINAAHDASWVVVAGSLPPGVEPEFYAELIRRLAGEDVRVAVDTSGPALLAAVTAKPSLIKPNHHELEEAANRPLRTLKDVVEAATALSSWTARAAGTPRRRWCWPAARSARATRRSPVSWPAAGRATRRWCPGWRGERPPCHCRAARCPGRMTCTRSWFGCTRGSTWAGSSRGITEFCRMNCNGKCRR
jgi:1-phosphofructokinase family hexose kinase